MKALSLRQPWAFAVVHLGKTIENRRWNTSFRGEFLIHAAKGMTHDAYDDAIYWCSQVLGLTRLDAAALFPSIKLIERGGIVGRASLVRTIPPCVAGPSLFDQHCPHPWHMPEQFGFVLADVKPVAFVPLAGSLGFFGVPDAIAERALRP